MSTTPLLPAQIESIQKLSKQKVGALFMEAGTGKTRTALNLIQSAPVTKVLWFAPYKSINPTVEGSGIVSEVAKWTAYTKPTKFVGIESLQNSERIYLECLDYVDEQTFVVVDESLKIKNSDAIRTKRITTIGSKAQYKLILNGTPISRNMLDVWAQMNFLSPSILNMGFTQFYNTFCEHVSVKRRKSSKHTYQTREFIVGYHNVDELYKLIQPYIFEADLELNVKQQHIDVMYSLDVELEEKYEKLKKKLLTDTPFTMTGFLELTQKLQHLYCDADAKFDCVEKILEKKGIDNCVIFTKYIRSREALAKKFPKALVLSIQSDAMSLNLQDRNTTIEFDKTWDYALIDQYRHRVYRTGQESDCYHYTLTADNKLDQLIRDNNSKKQNLLDYFKQIISKEVLEELV